MRAVLTHCATLLMFSSASMTDLSFFFSSRRRHTRSLCDWSSDVCSSDLRLRAAVALEQVLGRERPPVDEVGVRVVAPPQLERIDLQARGQLVEHALEAERPLDE